MGIGVGVWNEMQWLSPIHNCRLPITHLEQKTILEY